MKVIVVSSLQVTVSLFISFEGGEGEVNEYMYKMMAFQKILYMKDHSYTCAESPLGMYFYSKNIDVINQEKKRRNIVREFFNFYYLIIRYDNGHQIQSNIVLYDTMTCHVHIPLPPTVFQLDGDNCL